MITFKMAAGALLVCLAIALMMPPVVGGFVALSIPTLAAGVCTFGSGLLDARGVQ